MLTFTGIVSSNVLVVAILEDDHLAAPHVRLVSAVRHLVAPLLHLDALPVVAGELALLFAASQLQHRRVRFSFIALIIIV